MRNFVSLKNYPPQGEKRRIFLWSLVLFYISLIFISTPFALPIWNFLEKEMRLNFNLVMLFLGAGIFFGLNYFFIKTSRNLRYCLILTFIFFGYAFLFFYFAKFPTERFHLFEYGFLSFLVYQALAMDLTGKKVYGLGMIIVMVVGMFDEVIQRFVPQRYADIRDVFINSFSGLLGFAIISILIKASSRKNGG